MTEDDEDPVEFIFGDDYGDIETEVMGSHNGITTRRMRIPHRLALDLHEELSVKLEEAADKYIVYGHDDGRIANIVIVEANSEDEAIQKSSDTSGWMGYRVAAKKIDEYPKYGDTWAAIH